MQWHVSGNDHHDPDVTDNTRAMEASTLGTLCDSIFASQVTIGNRTIDGSRLKRSVFHDFPAARMYSVTQEWVFPFIKSMLQLHYVFDTGRGGIMVRARFLSKEECVNGIIDRAGTSMRLFEATVLIDGIAPKCYI